MFYQPLKTKNGLYLDIFRIRAIPYKHYFNCKGLSLEQIRRLNRYLDNLNSFNRKCFDYWSGHYGYFSLEDMLSVQLFLSSGDRKWMLI